MIPTTGLVLLLGGWSSHARPGVWGSATARPGTFVGERADLALQAIAGWAGLLEEQQFAVPTRQLAHQTPDRLRSVVDPTKEADLALAAVFGRGH